MSATSSSAGGAPRERRLAQLRRAPGQAERRVHRALVGRVRERPERVHVGRRAGRAQQRRPGRLRRGHEQLDRHALDGDADRAALLPLDHRDDRAELGEAREHRRRVGGGAHHREVLGCVAPAPQRRPRARRRARRRSPCTSSRARLSVSARCGRGPGGRASASRSCASVFGPTPGTSRSRPAAAAARSSSTVSTPSARAMLDAALRAQPEVAAEADEAGGELALELGQLRDVAGLDELAQLGPRCRGRSRAARARARPARAARPAAAWRGSSRPRAGTRGRCRGSPPPARAAWRSPPAGRRCARCPRDAVWPLRGPAGGRQATLAGVTRRAVVIGAGPNGLAAGSVSRRRASRGGARGRGPARRRGADGGADAARLPARHVLRRPSGGGRLTRVRAHGAGALRTGVGAPGRVHGACARRRAGDRAAPGPGGDGREPRRGRRRVARVRGAAAGAVGGAARDGALRVPAAARAAGARPGRRGAARARAAALGARVRGAAVRERRQPRLALRRRLRTPTRRSTVPGARSAASGSRCSGMRSAGRVRGAGRSGSRTRSWRTCACWAGRCARGRR